MLHAQIAGVWTLLSSCQLLFCHRANPTLDPEISAESTCSAILTRDLWQARTNSMVGLAEPVRRGMPWRGSGRGGCSARLSVSRCRCFPSRHNCSGSCIRRPLLWQMSQRKTWPFRRIMLQPTCIRWPRQQSCGKASGPTPLRGFPYAHTIQPNSRAFSLAVVQARARNVNRPIGELRSSLMSDATSSGLSGDLR
jgi:hypothetical protein